MAEHPRYGAWRLLGLLLLVANPATASLTAQERLHYQVRYQGIFSGWTEMEIAEAQLTLYHDADQQLPTAILTATTEPFPAIDALVAFRFHYQSWFDASVERTLAVNMCRQSTRPKLQALWFDQGAGLVRRFERRDRPGQPAPPPPDYLRQVLDQGCGGDQRSYQQTRTQPMPDGILPLDRLAMLYTQRRRPLVTGGQWFLHVANGKDLRGYRVAVVGREPLTLAGRERPAIKLRFESDYADPDEQEYPAVFVWLSDDPQRLPLRFASEGMLGRFEINLVGDPDG